MFHYFGYGSNMNLVSLAAKGVVPASSTKATLPGWRLRFNVHHWFRHEGGVGNIDPTDQPGLRVLGVVHEIDESHLAKLDAVESYGVGYDRIEVEVHTKTGPVRAITYVGIDSYKDDSCLPTRRYLNILVAGARAMGIDADYVQWLESHPVHQPENYPAFTPPSGEHPVFTEATLPPKHTGLAGHVFDMSDCRWQHECLWDLFGGKDMTVFHLKRMDRTDGAQTPQDVVEGRLSPAQDRYLRAYLNEYHREYRYAGTLSYTGAPQ